MDTTTGWMIESAVVLVAVIPVSSGTVKPVGSAGARTAPEPGSTGTLADPTRQLRDQAGPIAPITCVRRETGMGSAEAKSSVDALR